MKKSILALFCVLTLPGCGPLISDYSIEAYKNATTLKAETGAIVEKSNQPYASLRKAVDTNTTKINAAYEFAAGLPYNSLSARQWQILRDPNGSLYGWYINYWKSHGAVSVAFRDQFKQQIDAAFDEIICLESNKKASAACSKAGAPTDGGESNKSDTGSTQKAATKK